MTIKRRADANKVSKWEVSSLFISWPWLNAGNVCLMKRNEQ